MWGGRLVAAGERTSVGRGPLCALIAAMAVGAPEAFGCSVSTGCNFDVHTVRPEFPVTVMHQGQPLRGAKVSVSYMSEDKPQALEFETDASGHAEVRNLRPGRWSLSVSYLGVSGGGGCLQVSSFPLRTAHRSLSYNWGDSASASTAIAGSVVDSQPGRTGNPLLDRVRRIQVPIPGARLRLESPSKGELGSKLTDEKGEYSFDEVPDGVYVLYVEDVRAYIAVPPTRWLIRKSSAASSTRVVFFTQGDSGSCGGPLAALFK